MGVLIKPEDRILISVIELESGHHKSWVDKTINSINRRVPQ